MEAIIDYKLSEFLQITDINLITNYLFVLDLLKPLKSIDNPRFKRWKIWSNKEPKQLIIKAPRELTFADVTNIRNYFNEATIHGVIESVKLVSGLSEREILELRITQFYGIINFMKEDLIQLANMEINELSDDSFDMNLESVNAKGRMARFGVLNTIDSLAKEDILRWEEIEKLPYMTVFTKLLMDKEKNDIQRELAEIQKRKQKQ
ncbi:hypothetical protein ABGT15_04515 [Flavobacterium enshiense]|uniref:hypothetical protein n=1 Tax=Flavobacterium enshiense TaxID=1341165 RepID=UPI00345D9326